jgi:serine protease DegQ
VRGGPADRAGIRPGDILLNVDGKQVSNTSDMLNVIAQLAPGGKARMTVMRKNHQATLAVTVGTRPPQTP